MKYQNTWKRILCVLLAVCSILSGINFNRMETGAKVNEKKLYMDYLAKIDKKCRKYSRNNPEYNVGYLKYKILDLDGDGQKELIYTVFISDPKSAGIWSNQGWICTLKKGKVHKVWSDNMRGFEFYRIKGEKKKLVVSMAYYGRGAVSRWIYTFSSGKVKEEGMYTWIWNEDYYLNKNGKRVKQPSELKKSKLKPINLKEYNEHI